MLGRTHDLQGRIALVIGGGMGVGTVVAHQLASQTELVGRVSGRYGLPPQAPKYNTLAKIAELILTSAA